MTPLRAGAAETDITPANSQFLWGYPHVERYSTGIHDPLYSSAFYLDDGRTRILFIANDIIFVDKHITRLVRERISAETGVPAGNILISATHTHSGPMIVEYVSNRFDSAVPKPDPGYIDFVVGKMTEAGCTAAARAVPARLEFALADGTGIGGNRRDPAGGVADPEVAVLAAVHAENGTPIGCMLVYSMHPTVLHEDSSLISADFPGAAKKYVKEKIFGTAAGGNVPVVYHTGPAGNQSPRHAVKENTFAEAERLGGMLGRRVEDAWKDRNTLEKVTLAAASAEIDLPRRTFPNAEEARAKLEAARKRLEELRNQNAPWQEVRTAEVDWFGAEETLALARSQEEGLLEEYYNRCMPAEIQVVRVGGLIFVGWQGECFVEYALELKKRFPDTYVISLANGELQGYIVTPEAEREGGYEASNGLFTAESGKLLVQVTAGVIEKMQADGG
jgi:neutral ceramidase